MNAKQNLVWGAVLTLSFASTFVSAATVYHATRLDYRPEHRDLNITIVVTNQSARVDVMSDRHPLITMIESGNRLAFIDFSNRVYAVRDEHRSDQSASALQSTTRQLFALGSYCHVFEAHWSDAVYQERCVAPQNVADRISSRVGDFLALIAATSDINALFAQAAHLASQAETNSGFPYIVRHIEQGHVMSELRMLSVAEDGASTGAFDIPKGLRRVSFDIETKQAAN